MSRARILITLARRCVAVSLACIGLAFASPAQGQSLWEYSPYEVRLLIAAEPSPQLSTASAANVADSTAVRLQTLMGAAWHCSGALAAGPHAASLSQSLEELTPERALLIAGGSENQLDKLYLAALAWQDGQFQIALREFDCRTQQLGPLASRNVAQLPMLPAALEDLVLNSFTPLARIETVTDQQVTARLRAGALATTASSYILVEPGSVLRPIIRRTERKGQSDAQEIPWTLLDVTARNDSLLDCTLYSGYRAAIPTRASSRVDRLALLVRPHLPATRLTLRARDNPAKPLSYYEIHTRIEGTDKTELLGLTNLDGAIDIPRTDAGLQLLFVRHGKQLLARLPLVPGHHQSLTADLADDDLRLEAEGYTDALANRIVDLVARRELLAARIRARLKENQTSEAQKLLDEFRKLETRNDLSRELEQTRQRLASKDRLTQSRIDKLFADARQLLQLRALGDELLAQLTRDLTTASPTAAPLTSDK